MNINTQHLFKNILERIDAILVSLEKDKPSKI